tara:strand:+ start:15803 stop:16024 length:222 start_codon:yes stop_codon:yes gene_type:complete
MSQPLNQRPRLQALRDRLTHLTEAETDEAEARFWQYTEIVRGIFLRRILEAKRDGQGPQDSTKPHPDSKVDTT